MNKKLHIGLWVIQVLLALAFVSAGFMKATGDLAELSKQMTWIPMVGHATTRFIGVSEFLGGVGLILPAALRIVPKLTGIAAALLTVVMVLAVATHVIAGDNMFAPSLVLGGLSAFVAWGRLKAAPISAKS